MPRLTWPIRSAMAPSGGLEAAMTKPAMATMKLHWALPATSASGPRPTRLIPHHSKIHRESAREFWSARNNYSEAQMKANLQCAACRVGRDLELPPGLTTIGKGQSNHTSSLA